jgi:zinc protease
MSGISFSAAKLASKAVRLGVASALPALAMLFTASVSQPAAAMNIQQITSPGGIKAWLVEEHSVPLISLRYAFDGGNSQDPPGKEGLANFITAMMDEGAGDIKSEDYQERMEDIAMRMSYDDSKDSLYGSFETLEDLGAEAALRYRCCRAHQAAAAGEHRIRR